MKETDAKSHIWNSLRFVWLKDDTHSTFSSIRVGQCLWMVSCVLSGGFNEYICFPACRKRRKKVNNCWSFFLDEWQPVAARVMSKQRLFDPDLKATFVTLAFKDVLPSVLKSASFFCGRSWLFFRASAALGRFNRSLFWCKRESW